MLPGVRKRMRTILESVAPAGAAGQSVLKQNSPRKQPVFCIKTASRLYQCLQQWKRFDLFRKQPVSGGCLVFFVFKETGDGAGLFLHT
jgi:hypothetical protein